MDYGRLDTNPAEKVRLKKRSLANPKPFLRSGQFYGLLELIAEPYATMVYVAVFVGLRVSELAGLLGRNIHIDSITIDRRFSRGDWDEPKSIASKSTIPVDAPVIQRIHRLKFLEITVRAGRACRRYKAVKSRGPDDLVFQSVVKGAPMRDNNILVRHIKPAARKLGIEWGQLARVSPFVRDLAAAGGRRCQRRSRAAAPQPRQHDDGHLSAVGA